MAAEVTMPQLSDTMTEGTVVKWHKKEGDKVKAGEEIADVETDKAVMPMEAFDGGTLAVIKVKEGEKIAVGGLLAVIATGSEKVADLQKKYAAASAGSGGTPGPVEKSEQSEKRGKTAKPQAAEAPAPMPSAVATITSGP